MGEVLPKVTSLLEYMIMHNVEIFEVAIMHIILPVSISSSSMLDTG